MRHIFPLRSNGGSAHPYYTGLAVRQRVSKQTPKPLYVLLRCLRPRRGRMGKDVNVVPARLFVCQKCGQTIGATGEQGAYPTQDGWICAFHKQWPDRRIVVVDND